MSTDPCYPAQAISRDSSTFLSFFRPSHRLLSWAQCPFLPHAKPLILLEPPTRHSGPAHALTPCVAFCTATDALTASKAYLSAAASQPVSFQSAPGFELTKWGLRTPLRQRPSTTHCTSFQNRVANRAWFEVGLRQERGVAMRAEVGLEAQRRIRPTAMSSRVSGSFPIC